MGLPFLHAAPRSADKGRNLGDDNYDYGELRLEPDGFHWDLPIALYSQQKSARMGAQRGWFTIRGSEYDSLAVLCCALT